MLVLVGFDVFDLCIYYANAFNIVVCVDPIDNVSMFWVNQSNIVVLVITGIVFSFSSNT